MKVLIVEDSLYKLDEEERVLRRLGLNEYICCSCVMDATEQIVKSDIDLIVADLGLPLRSKEMVMNPLEGMLMLHTLAYKDVLIPTVVYSTTDIPEEAIRELEEFDFPFLGQAKDIITLRVLIQKYLEQLKMESERKATVREDAQRVGTIKPWDVSPHQTIKDKIPISRKRRWPKLK